MLSQQMGDLPSPCVRAAPPFSNVGVDYAGLFLLRRGCGRLWCIDEKVWAAVFVCMVTKAVHIELADGCSSAEFVDVFARFVARHGWPSHVYSDCGTNFIGADAAFRELAQSPKVAEYFAS